jgi:hypothetical protein
LPTSLVKRAAKADLDSPARAGERGHGPGCLGVLVDQRESSAEVRVGERVQPAIRAGWQLGEVGADRLDDDHVGQAGEDRVGAQRTCLIL